MKRIFELFTYYRECKENNRLTDGLYWFKKNRGIKWIKGQNFGDYLSCIIVSSIAQKLGLRQLSVPDGQKFLAVGSVLHLAADGDIVWGSGVNGKVSNERHSFSKLDVRMVRGPKTREYLVQKGIPVPEVYGDPVLLLPELFPELKVETKPGKVIVLPNLNELDIIKRRIPEYMQLVSPYMHWKKVLQEILKSELVLTSSLHGIIASEAFGVPVRFVMPVGGETLFKYQDYYNGTGRYLDTQPATFCDEITSELGIKMEKPIYNSEEILNTFPQDLFK
jgi:pyruvyltransferase